MPIYMGPRRGRGMNDPEAFASACVHMDVRRFSAMVEMADEKYRQTV